MPKFEVTDLKALSEKLRSQPQFKYASELMNETNPELVFKELLLQPVTLKLRDLLGSSFELSQQLQTTTKAQQFPIQQVRTSNIEVGQETISTEAGFQNEEGYKPELSIPPECTVDSNMVGSSEDLNVGSGDFQISQTRASNIGFVGVPKSGEVELRGIQWDPREDVVGRKIIYYPAHLYTTASGPQPYHFP